MGGMRGYRMEEVAKHKTARDAWAVFGGKVYNLTPYLPYHPGGAGIIVKTAGTDCTALFNKHHPWVNFEGLAGVCFVGGGKGGREGGREGRRGQDYFFSASFSFVMLAFMIPFFLILYS